MSEGANRTYDVFLSYSTKDKTWADAACAVLERHRVRCWIAPRDITPGEEWGASIIKGLNGSRIMVLIFSGHANDSGQVRREVERAISQGMTVLPVRVEDVRPEGAMEFALGNTHWLDAFSPPVERQMEKLAGSVKTLLGNDVDPPADDSPIETPQYVAPTPWPPWVWPSVVAGALMLGLLAAWLGGAFKVKTPNGQVRGNEDPKSTGETASTPADVTRGSSSIAVESPARTLDTPPAAEGGEIVLFNGKNLEGWTSHKGLQPVLLRPELFVDRGELHSPRGVIGGPTTVASYQNFVLKLEYRVPAGAVDRDSGIELFWSQKGTLPLQVKGLEIIGEHTRGNISYTVKPRETGNLSANAPPGISKIRRRQQDAERPIGQWNDIEIWVRGPELTFLLNGRIVNQAKTNDSRPYHIGMNWSSGSDIRYRNIRLRPLLNANSDTARAAGR